jgi:hypothetical protein
MNDIYAFVLEHVMAWLPGLWDYSRPADLVVVFLGMAAFVVFIRLVVKLLPVLLLAGVILVLAHAGLPRLHAFEHSGFRRELGISRRGGGAMRIVGDISGGGEMGR